MGDNHPFGPDVRDIPRDPAVRIAASRFWERLSAREIALFQLSNDTLCMPFDVYHRAVEEALGQPVMNIELGNPVRLLIRLLDRIGSEVTP